MRTTSSSASSARTTSLTSDTRVKYIVNRFGAVSAYYRYTKRDSDVPVFSYDKHQVGMNVTAQF